MKIKIAITITLSHQPKTLILDEQTSGLDPIMRDEILDVFMDFIQDEKHAIVLSSHILSDLEKMLNTLLLYMRENLFYLLQKMSVFMNMVL